MSPALTAAVVGTGFIGPVHVEALQRAGVDVSGILGSTPDKSRAAAAALRLDRGYASLEELLADDQVDAVHIATPNRLHFEQTAAALRAGKHVLCEKPLAMNSDESAALVRLAAESRRAAGVNYNIRYYPLCLEAAERVRDAEIGRVLHIAGSYVQDWLLHETDFNWRLLAEEGGELRAVSDIGTHWLDLAQFIAGQKVVSVCADLLTAHPVRRQPRGNVQTFGGDADDGGSTPVQIATDDYGAVLLGFESGVRGVLWVSQVTAGRKNCLRLEIAGDKRSLAWDSERPNELWIGQRETASGLLLRDPALLGSRARQHAAYPGGHNEGFPDSHKQLFRDFYAYIAAGDFKAAPPFPTFSDGHRELLLCEAILQSHRERRWVDLEAD